MTYYTSGLQVIIQHLCTIVRSQYESGQQKISVGKHPLYVTQMCEIWPIRAGCVEIIDTQAQCDQIGRFWAAF